MASPDILGVPYADLVDPTWAALHAYIDLTDGRFSFGTDIPGQVGELGQFVNIPDRPNTTARIPEVSIFNAGMHVGNLAVIAFAPKDGTGDSSLFNSSDKVIFTPENLRFAERPDRVYPRDKTGIIAETHITAFSIDPNQKNPEPMPFAGRLTLLEPVYKDKPVKKVDRFPELQPTGTLGQALEDYARIMSGQVQANPTATLTTLNLTNLNLPEFGRQHAVFNNTQHIQVAGFWAIKEGKIAFPAQWHVGFPKF